MKPTVGRIVHYQLHDRDLPLPLDTNTYVAGDFVAAVIVRVWDDSEEEGFGCCNLRLLLDGPPQAEEWLTSIVRGSEPGMWNWPPRV